MNGLGGSVTFTGAVSSTCDIIVEPINPVSLSAGGGSTNMAVVVPAGCPAGSYPVTITASNSSNPLSPITHSQTATLTVLGAPPTITQISPTTGPPGTQVTITGTNFAAAQGSSSVTFGNGLAPVPAFVQSWSASQIVVLAPSGLQVGADYLIYATVSGDTVASPTSSYFVPQAAPAGPTITGLSLSQGPALVGFVISGSNLGAPTTVTLNGMPLNVTSSNAASITVQVPAVTAAGVPWPMGGPWSVIVTIPGSAPVVSPTQFSVINAFGCVIQ
jgi:hypothetical protein